MGFPDGPWYIDDTPVFTVITHNFSTGALADASAVPDYRVYENETGTAILTGSMAKLDDGNTLGFYSEQLTLSAANGFEVGKSYNVYVTATVDSITGGQTLSFKVIAGPNMSANVTQWLGTAAATPTVAGVPEVDVTHWLGTAAATPTVAGVPEVDLTHWLGTAAATPTVAGVPEVDLTHVAGATTNVAALATNVDAILTDTGTTLQAEVDGIEADVDILVSRLTSARAIGMDNLPNLDASVASRASSAALSSAASDITAIKTKTDQVVFTNANKVDAAVLNAADFAQAAADKAWSTTVRELTSGANIILNKGVELLGLNDISAADVWAAGTRTLTSFGSVATDVWSVVIENSKTALQYMRLIKAATLGKTTDTETGTIRFRDDADTKDRIVAVTDADNNRDSVTTDAT